MKIEPQGKLAEKGFNASFVTLEAAMESSFRASEARPGIQDLLKFLDSGFCRNDETTTLCRKGIGRIPSFRQAAIWWWRSPQRERFTRR